MDRTAPGPRCERVRLMDITRVREGDLQNRRLHGLPSHRDDDPDPAVLDHAVQLARPEFQQLLDDAGQRGKPL